MTAAAIRNLFWILIGAAILLLPAAIWGRPFVFYDTPDYWGWGRDIIEALQRPWPHPGQAWIPGRPLHGWELGAHGTTAGDLRFMLTAIASRSAFYAVPLYVLTSAGGLWLVVALQALAAAWTLRVAVRTLIPGAMGLSYLVVVTALTLMSSLGFEADYVMPDVFGGLALLAAGVLISRPERLGSWTRLGLCGLIVYAALAHAANGLDLAVAVALGVSLTLRSGVHQAAARVAPVAAALGVSLVVAVGGQMILAKAFGRPVHPAPFLASRVLADGSGQRYLRQACVRTKLASCDLVDVSVGYPEYYISLYPLEPPPPLTDTAHVFDGLQYRGVSDAEADHRERFLAEQPRLVLGAFLVDGPAQTRAMLASGAAEFFNFGVDRDFDSLRGLMREHTQRRDQIVAITPGAAECRQTAAKACGDLDNIALVALQGIAVWGSFAAVALGLFRKTFASDDGLRTFTTAMVCLVLANAFICGGLSGPYDRYQSRVEWLIPFCALLGLVQWVLRRNANDPTSGATLPSPVATIVAATSAARPS